MRFGYPQFLWIGCILMPLVAVFLVWSWKRKQKLISQFVASRLLANLTVGVSHTRQKLRLVLLGSAVGLILLAMARPQWGFDWEEARQQGLDILVAIDTSKSMLANDVTPTRLTRAKLAAFDLMKLAKSDRLGLIAFAGTAFLQTPLTLDEEAFRQSVETLDTGIIPQGGTAVAEAIDTATKAFETSGENHKILVLFTDGEDHDSDAKAAAEKAAKAGVRIFTIGIGSAEGELIRVPDEQGHVGFLKDEQGNVVKSHLNESLLQEIATVANGFYLPLRGPNPMETLYQRGLAPLPKSESTTKLVKNFRERFHWLAGLAFIVLAAEMFLPQQRRRARGDKASSTEHTLQKAAAIVALLLLPFASFASPSAAKNKYEAGKFSDALSEYQKVLKEKTNDYRIYYNAGDAAYRAKQFDEAKKYFDTAIVSPDLELQQRAYYNLGNTLYQTGEQSAEMDQKKEAWEQALHNYENALKLNANDSDASNNLQFVKRKLEELKKQEQQQQKNDKSKDNKDDKNDQKDQQQNQKDQKDKKDEKQDQKNSDQQQAKDQQQQQDQQKKDEEKRKQEQAKNDEQKDKQNAQQSKPGEDKKDEQQAGEPGKVAQMTPEQAQQFLEAMKQEDRALIFKPPQKETRGRPVKDW